MPIPTESLQALDDAVSRLAAESMLATAGRDDGMIPSYSLLGEIRELCASEPALCGPVIAVHAELDKLLESARPFDDAVLGRVRRLAEWMPAAVTCVESSQPVPSLEQAAPNPKSAAEPAGVHGAEVAADSLLSLNLDENRELLTEFHAEAVDHLQQIEAALLELEHRPNNQEALSSIFRSFHTIKGNAGFLGLGPMQSLAHEVESLLDLARNGRLVLSSPIITEILASRDALQAHTQQVAVELEKGQLPDRVVPVSHLILAVKRLAAGGSPESRPAAAFTSQPVKIDEAAATALVPAAVPEPMPQAAARAAVPESHAAGASQTVRVNTEKLDSLMDVVGELVIVQSQLIESTRGVGDGGSPLQRNVAQLSRITKELQHTAMALRMIPIKPTFQKMERLARDLARDFGKKVAFSTSGDETELDRTVVEQIGDPLVHMVRNALDHGLEPGADRVAHGKPEEGTLHLSAYHQGSNLVIELQDNGRGIDPEKILAKAKRQGLVPENALPDRNEIFNLIFLPGFSTAEKVTDLSGRGVGMDVVRRNIEKLRGKIEISSEVGIGSTFKIKLPLTMAIIDGLVVRVGEDRFILPATSVQRALKPSKEHVSTIHGQGEVLDVRGHLMPIHRLHRRLGIPADAQQPWDGIVVIVEHSGKVSALLVDEMVSKQEVVIKNLGACMQGLPGIAGGAILGDGNIALILDPGTLLQAA